MKKIIKSPCINICTTRGNVCLGCYRTTEEINNWVRYSDEEKKEILRKVSERKISERKIGERMDYYGFPNNKII